MASLARFVVSERYQRPLIAAIWLAVFLLCVALAGVMFVFDLREDLQTQTAAALDHYTDRRTKVLATFDTLDANVTAVPCTPAYFDQLRRVAYRPDGLNEFLYAENGRLICSVNVGRFEVPYVLDAPDIVRDNPFSTALWLDRDLSFVGLPGLTGTLARRGPHVIVVPTQPIQPNVRAWMDQEVVLRKPDGRRWWHISGEPGLYKMSRARSGYTLLPRDGGYLYHACDPVGVHCVASRADLLGYLAQSPPSLAVVVLAIGVFAAMLTQIVYHQLRRYWSFEMRFKRNLEEGIVCAYQPIVSTRSGAVTGCEVLVRWRDLDGSLAYPDTFLPLVERENLTLRLSQAVVTRAFSELAGRIERMPFQVNFNVFPRDFDATILDLIFVPELQTAGFSVAVELVETETLPFDRIQAAIAHLKTRGIRTYIDDFGAGYSNMQNLAVLDLDGVKIDRSFAMAPDNSLMARILSHAIDMAHESGRDIVIEGVETRERFEMLRRNRQVDFAQGYFISRPLDIEGLVRFVEAWSPPRKAEMRAAG